MVKNFAWVFSEQSWSFDITIELISQFTKVFNVDILNHNSPPQGRVNFIKMGEIGKSEDLFVGFL